MLVAKMINETDKSLFKIAFFKKRNTTNTKEHDEHKELYVLALLIFSYCLKSIDYSLNPVFKQYYVKIDDQAFS